MHKGLLVILVSIVLGAACTKREGLAPVVELKWQEYNTHKKQHIVRRGETLYAIAFRYDRDYRQLAQINHLQSPYTLRVGQAIALKQTSVFHSKKPIKRPEKIRIPPKKEPKMPAFNGHWSWPTNGKIISGYAPSQGKKGIDITGYKGEKIRAAAGGVVAYAGNGLPGYGNLIIIKHNNKYLTAYGNNARNFVGEGQRVKAGQVIAQMGVVDNKYWGLHFEIRKSGKPVNPLNYLRKT